MDMQSVSNIAYKEIYESKLGEFELLLTSTNEVLEFGKTSTPFNTVGHHILVKRTFPPLDWMPEHMFVETATAWLLYITKRNTCSEQLTLSMQTHNPTIQGDAETGERLIAIGFESGMRQLHIGTEDEESMAQRAAVNDWMPPRLARMLLAESSIVVTTITASGLHSQIPLLELGEQFYVHYIVAENPLRNSTAYPDEMDISTWFAVEQTKKQLENTWQEKAPTA